MAPDALEETSAVDDDEAAPGWGGFKLSDSCLIDSGASGPTTTTNIQPLKKNHYHLSSNPIPIMQALMLSGLKLSRQGISNPGFFERMAVFRESKQLPHGSSRQGSLLLQFEKKTLKL